MLCCVVFGTEFDLFHIALRVLQTARTFWAANFLEKREDKEKEKTFCCVAQPIRRLSVLLTGCNFLPSSLAANAANAANASSLITACVRWPCSCHQRVAVLCIAGDAATQHLSWSKTAALQTQTLPNYNQQLLLHLTWNCVLARVQNLNGMFFQWQAESHRRA